MRIVSKFRDYYDSGQAFGQDMTLNYIRESKTVELCDYAYGVGRYWSHSTYQVIEAHRALIGFCGRIHRLIIAHKTELFGRSRRFYCYTIDDLDRCVRTQYKPVVAEKYLADTSKHYAGLCRSKAIEWFDDKHGLTTSATALFTKHACPVFSLLPYGGMTELTANCRLAGLEFFRVHNPIQAYQELAMYLGGLAAPEKPIPQPSNQDMIAIKGFDKWSFRKPPRK